MIHTTEKRQSADNSPPDGLYEYIQWEASQLHGWAKLKYLLYMLGPLWLLFSDDYGRTPWASHILRMAVSAVLCWLALRLIK